MTIENKTTRVFLSGGLIGMLATDPKKALDKRLAREEAQLSGAKESG